MTEVVKPLGDPPVEPLGEGLPGGYESIEKMYADNQKFKQEAIDNKARKGTLTAAEAKLKEYEDAEATRLDGERTELERAQATIAALEVKALENTALISKAQMNTLFERELSSRLAGHDENSAKIKRMLYSAAVKDSEGFADAETLKLILDPVDELLKVEDGATGVNVIMNSQGLPVKRTPPEAQEKAAQDFLNLPYREQRKIARQKRNG